MEGQSVERRLAAVVAADIAGYSRLMGVDEVGTLQALQAHRRELIDPCVASFKGRIVKTMGDGLLIEFPSAVDAVMCAISVQTGMTERTSGAPRKMQFRIGIHVGDVIVDGDDIFGDGVNLAARVEAECEPGGVCLSSGAFEQVRGKLACEFNDLGERSLKNIERPIRLYALRLTADPAEAATVSVSPLSAAFDQSSMRASEKPSIAVLPFQNMSGDPEQEYFADGIVEDIITALSRFKSLFVIARNSSFTYKGRAIDLRKVGQELGVRYVLEGSIRKSSERLRITGQLIDSTNGAHIWADKFDGLLRDVFDLQDQITMKVVASVAPTIERAEIERLRLKPTNSMDSYDSYLRGLELFNHYQFREARQMFKQASVQAKDHAAAYAMAASTIGFEKSSKGTIPSAEDKADALRDVRIALQLADDDAFVLARCGWVLAYVGFELDYGAALVERAVALNPNLSIAWLARGWISLMVSEPRRSIESFERLFELSPIDPSRSRAMSGVAHAHGLLGEYEKGREIGKIILEELPYLQTFAAYIVNCVGCGRLDEARTAAAQLMKLEPNFRISQTPLIFLTRKAEHRRIIDSAFRAAGVPE